jgi:nucleoside phosphorylase
MAEDFNIALLFALEREAKPWLKRSRATLQARLGRRSLWRAEHAEARILTAVIGSGEQHAREGARWVFDRSRPDLALVCGLAGALRPDLCVGDIVLGERVLDRSKTVAHEAPTEFFRFAESTALHWRRTIGITCEGAFGAMEEKLKLARAAGADWVDMESAIVLMEAGERGIPALAVRSIGDGVRRDLPLDFNAAFDPDRGAWPTGKILAQLVRRPWALPGLVRLQADTRRAAVRLADFLCAYLACLADRSFWDSAAERELYAEVT